MRCIPWTPCNVHAGTRIRTHTPDEGEEEQPGGEVDCDVRVHNDGDDCRAGRSKNVDEAHQITQGRMGQSYPFYVQARDVVKDIPAPCCRGCKFATGQVSTLCGHSTACKSRMTKLMAEGRDANMHGKKCFMEKGIGVQKGATGGGGSLRDDLERRLNSEQGEGAAA